MELGIVCGWTCEGDTGMFLGWAYEGETGTRYVPRLGI